MARTIGRAVEVDLDSWPTLVRFAAIARVDRSGLSRERLAERMNKRSSNLHSALFGRTGPSEPITRSFLQELERTLRMVGEDTVDASPSRRRWPLTTLTGLREELSEEREPDPGVRVHGAWFADLCAAGPARNPVEVLVRGEALHDLLLHRARPEPGVRPRPLDRDETQAVTDLLSVAGLPPSTGMAAIRVLARIGAAAIPEIEREVYQSPVGFRSLRPLSRMLWRIGLRRSGKSEEVPWPDEEKALLDDLERVLLRIVVQEPADACLGRGFFVEALRRGPAQWDWVPAQLDEMARRRSRPVRERMFALGVAADRLPHDAAARLLRDVRDEAGTSGEQGLTWAIDVIEHRARPDGRRWPAREEPRVVAGVLGAIDDVPRAELPASVADGAKALLEEALLTFDETRRRRTCDVLNVAHLSDAVSGPIAEVYRERGRAPRWLREHSAYVLGYLDGHEALDPLREIVADPSDDPSVLHAAAWGLGDSCGVGDRHRDCLPVGALTRLLLETEHDAPRQAAAYALAIVHPRSVLPTLAHVVNVMDTDRSTRALARWGQWLHEADGAVSRLDDEIGITGSRTLVFGRQSGPSPLAGRGITG